MKGKNKTSLYIYDEIIIGDRKEIVPWSKRRIQRELDNLLSELSELPKRGECVLARVEKEINVGGENIIIKTYVCDREEDKDVETAPSLDVFDEPLEEEYGWDEDDEKVYDEILDEILEEEEL